MLFNSFSYGIFLPLVFIIYWCLPHRFRWVLLLLSSYYFYMSWNLKYVVLILGTTVVSYAAALLLERASSVRKKNWILAGTVVICLGVLFVFKYLEFLLNSFVSFANMFTLKLHPVALGLMLPVGISFYTFQTMSYVIDVYRGNVKAEHHFGYYAAFVSFFPQLVAGPIERSSNLLPQISSRKTFDYEQAADGMRLMLWGFFKKIVVADTLAVYVDNVYGNISGYSGFAFVLATFFFTIQIYCDFSGYSNIAIGSAKLFGVNLMTNFASPYFSKSIKEFWSRWHISLSTWFKDYVYIPLGGNRCSKLRNSFNLIVTFLVSGIWHGADWTYVIWGGIHGIAQVLEKAADGPLKKLKSKKTGVFISWLFVFMFCNFAWVFFRASSLHDALYVIGEMFSGLTSPMAYLKGGFGQLYISLSRLVYLAGMLIILGIVDFISYRTDMLKAVRNRKPALRWVMYVALAVVVVLFSSKGAAAEFVYFQF